MARLRSAADIPISKVSRREASKMRWRGLPQAAEPRGGSSLREAIDKQPELKLGPA